MQPVNSSEQLELGQPMKEPETIVVNCTYQLSNRRCESNEDKASAFVRMCLTGGRARNSTVALRHALVTIVNAPTRIGLKWTGECDEPITRRRNQHLWTRLTYASQERSDVVGTTRLQDLMGKAVKDP